MIADEDFAATSIAQENKIPNVIITDIFETSFIKGKLFSPIEKKMNKVMKDTDLTFHTASPYQLPGEERSRYLTLFRRGG